MNGWSRSSVRRSASPDGHGTKATAGRSSDVNETRTIDRPSASILTRRELSASSTHDLPKPSSWISRGCQNSSGPCPGRPTDQSSRPPGSNRRTRPAPRSSTETPLRSAASRVGKCRRVSSALPPTMNTVSQPTSAQRRATEPGDRSSSTFLPGSAQPPMNGTMRSAGSSARLRAW